ERVVRSASNACQISRRYNEKSVELMKKNGIKLVEIPEENLKVFYDAGKRARENLVGKLYSQEFLDRVENALREFRAGKAVSQ
ncbi:MAG: hypothetical protein ACE5GL_03510, partial [Calditrichia bacterium]